MKISLKTGVILTFAIGLIYSLVISFYDLTGWFHSSLLHFQRERLLIYFLAFLLGSLCYKLKVFDADRKNRRLFIWSNVLLTLSLGIFTVVALNLFFNMIEPGRDLYIASPSFDIVLYYMTSLLSMFCFLHIFIHLFRFNFNKTGKLLGQLSKNSYHVYIIHVVVTGIITGIIALILLNITMPAMIKFIILTVLTFVISNIIVYGYSEIIQKPVSLKPVIATASILVLIAFAFIGKLVNPTDEHIQLSKAETTMLPRMGLHKAAVMGDFQAIKQHINSGSNLDKTEPSRGSSPLITAATFGKTQVAIALIEAGADVNYKNNDGSTPLHTAAFFCRTEIVEALLSHGADKNLKNNRGSTALESVAGPFEDVKSIYEYFQNTLEPLGLKLDYEQIKESRPIISKMLQSNTTN